MVTIGQLFAIQGRQQLLSGISRALVVG
jgi:hypothetical protein